MNVSCSYFQNHQGYSFLTTVMILGVTVFTFGLLALSTLTESYAQPLEEN
jgi:hypothetical protein